MDKTYDFKFVETVITMTDSFAEDMQQRVFKLAECIGRSGIDEWREFIMESATKFEEYTKDIDWDDSPPTDYFDAVDRFCAMVNVGDDDISWPTKERFLARIRSGADWPKGAEDAFVEISEFIELGDFNSDESFRRELSTAYDGLRRKMDDAGIDVWLDDNTDSNGNDAIWINFRSKDMTKGAWVDCGVVIRVGDDSCSALQMLAAIDAIEKSKAIYDSINNNKRG